MSHLDERDLLARELRERADGVDGHPITMRDIHATAGRMRRRRSMVTGAVAAAVAAVALPTGLAVTAALDGGGNPDRPVVAETPTVLPTPNQVARGSHELSLDGAPRGEDPRIAYLDRDRLVLEDGRVVALDKEYQAVARAGSRWVALAQDEGVFTRDLLDEDGAVTDSAPSSWGLATDLDGGRVAFVEVQGGSWSLVDLSTDTMHTRSPQNPSNRPLQPVGYAGDGVLVYDAGEGEETQVRVMDASARDYELPAEPRLLTASAASEAQGLVAGMTESRDGASCWSVVSYRTGQERFDTCTFALGSFSPDGRYVVGIDSGTDGLGPREFAVLDATTGEVVLSFDQQHDGQMWLGDLVWEDSGHVLATVTDGLETRIVRFGLDGRLELASDAFVAEEYDVPAPVHLAATP